MAPRVHLSELCWTGRVAHQARAPALSDVRACHLGYYLDEYTFRFKRRASLSRGKLFYRLVQQALEVDPLPEAELTASASRRTDEDFDVLES